MNRLVPQSLPTEQRKVAGSIPAPVILINAVNSPVYGLDWPVPVETDNRSRCGRSLVRCGAHLGLEIPCQAFWWSGHAPVTNVACNCVPAVRTGRVGIHPQPNAGLVENVQFGAAGCEARGSGSTCRWRRSAVVRIPAFRAGHRDGRNAATRGRPRRRAGRRRQTWHRRWCPIKEVVKLSRGGLKPRAMGRQRASILDYRCR